MKTKILFLFALVMISIDNLHAQDDAKNILDGIYEKIKSYKTISIEFKNVFDNEHANIHQETRGTVQLRGDEYYLNYMGIEQIFDGNKLYTIQHEDEEVVISNYNPDEQNNDLTLSKMLTFYQDGYLYKMGSAQNIKGRNIQYIHLTPIDLYSDIREIIIGVDIRAKNIYEIIEQGKNGVKTKIQIINFESDKPIPDNLFNFDINKYRDQENYFISEPN